MALSKNANTPTMTRHAVDIKVFFNALNWIRESTPSQPAFYQATKVLESMETINADLKKYLNEAFR